MNIRSIRRKVTAAVAVAAAIAAATVGGVFLLPAQPASAVGDRLVTHSIRLENSLVGHLDFVQEVQFHYDSSWEAFRPVKAWYYYNKTGTKAYGVVNTTVYPPSAGGYRCTMPKPSVGISMSYTSHNKGLISLNCPFFVGPGTSIQTVIRYNHDGFDKNGKALTRSFFARP